ncbi:MAG TPA: hypothetical protein VFC05_12835 [Nitrososphaeraceae archaeon]|nr:hypothetical protein [Nitrososphaeraceae archaeon]
MIESIISISVFFLSGLILNISIDFEVFEQIINIGILSFSLLLFIISIIAYRKTGLKKIIYASLAFILFTIQLTYEILGDTIYQVETPYNDLIISSITLFILLLFFFAVFRKN